MTTSGAIAQFKDYVLQPEREDAERRLANTSYWGDTGRWVILAIIGVEGAINCVPCGDRTVVSDWLAEVIAAIEAEKARFRSEEDDPDGYGSATFSACLRRVQALQEACDDDAA